MQDSPVAPIIVRCNTSTETAIYTHLLECSDQFIPPLGDRVDLGRYANKLYRLAFRHEAWHKKSLVGLVAVYLPEEGQVPTAFVSNVSILSSYRRYGIAKQLLADAHINAATASVQKICLQVSCENTAAINLYQSIGYRQSERSDDQFTLCLDLGSKDVTRT
ncbi:GNAT family N-acetyltransferase [Roseiconus lacunae]|uniref:GNAT family N-acetyltransferase n=1 Tax=Roseiconus lacunae TaxID=2605694 RepID=UPI001E5530E2|nr:GNAT family N-acetyltransferase [Roseiconus lacunae]MCD0459916.1 GNAT family N-acetyltransferase [Roseiconus lacunae]WRQ49936.1 GNAT family N-acetyltransferase [Stieleria sp. HD01]